MAVEFGCKACFQGDAEKVWEARQFDSVARLVDDSHFSIAVMVCEWCGQGCVKVFTEFVDWSGGDDAQYWYLIPITADESDGLIAQGEKVDTKSIDAMSAGRRILQVDYPTGGEKRVHWAVGPTLIVQGH